MSAEDDEHSERPSTSKTTEKLKKLKNKPTKIIAE
jgi:hypothetical protein